MRFTNETRFKMNENWDENFSELFGKVLRMYRFKLIDFQLLIIRIQLFAIKIRASVCLIQSKLKRGKHVCTCQ